MAVRKSTPAKKPAIEPVEIGLAFAWVVSRREMTTNPDKAATFSVTFSPRRNPLAAGEFFTIDFPGNEFKHFKPGTRVLISFASLPEEH